MQALLGNNREKWAVTWTGRMIEVVIQMAGRGNSASEIGMAIGKSRNAVIGKCHRKNIQLGGKSGFKPAPKTSKPLPAPKPQYDRGFWHGKPVHISKFKHGCRFPVMPDIMLWCGNPKLHKGGPWCAHHAQVCYLNEKK